ncbi:MAG: hypothetical protein J6C85_08330 [Alphaproteobacteria bacterium]|nr:hypothetical protein [Alphaproteobacteria bacterium]
MNTWFIFGVMLLSIIGAFWYLFEWNILATLVCLLIIALCDFALHKSD